MRNIVRNWSVRALLFFAGLVLLIVLLLQPVAVYHFRDLLGVIFPKGSVAVEERNLLIAIQAVMLLVIVPVYVLTFVFSWKYRSGNKSARYEPHLIDNLLAEVFWWGIPLILTALVCYWTWVKTYELDPYKPLVSDKKPITIQAIALQWKWLFLYPDEGVATLNYLEIPVNVPIHFEVTADAPMNSLWIPKLGGQIYAMPNAKTELHLIANEVGEFRGSSANISGTGFADMHFKTRASTQEAYNTFLDQAKKSKSSLTWESYQVLAKPSSKDKPQLFQLKEKELFDQILKKYEAPK